MGGLAHKVSLTSPLDIEVPASNQQSEQLCICVLGMSILLWFLEFSDSILELLMWYLFFLNHFFNKMFIGFSFYFLIVLSILLGEIIYVIYKLFSVHC